MKEEKLQTEEISTKDSKFLSWLDNFWYHYKWHTIVTVFIVLILGISTAQACNSEKSDIIFTYAGPKEFITAPEEKLAINSSLSDISKKIYGEKSNASINTFLVYSKEQIEEIESELDENGKQKYVIDTAFNTNEMNSFNEFSKSGASFILLLDPSVYQGFIAQNGEAERLIELSAIYGSTPEGAIDKYSVRLGDTKIYQTVPELQVLPADTVVCLHGKLILSTKQKDYDMQTQVFKEFATLSTIESSETDTVE